MFRQDVAPYMRVERQHVLTGGQFGEGFGYDIAVDDFNGDGSVMILLLATLLCCCLSLLLSILSFYIVTNYVIIYEYSSHLL